MVGGVIFPTSCFASSYLVCRKGALLMLILWPATLLKLPVVDSGGVVGSLEERTKSLTQSGSLKRGPCHLHGEIV